MPRTLALFDFDGTITTDDSLLKFIRFVVGDIRFLLGLVVLSPILTAYIFKLIPNYQAKQKMLSWFFKGCSEEYFLKVANEYSLVHIDKILRPKAIERLQWHKKEGHRVIIVSASLDCWLRPWCDENQFELLATKLEISEGKITGQLASQNCYGQEKVNRINEHLNLDDYEVIYAYGDSSGDKEMLELANEQAYKPFRQN